MVIKHGKTTKNVKLCVSGKLKDMYSPVCVLWYLLYIAYSNGSKTKVFIHTDNVIQTIPDRFLSVTIDTALIQANWATLNFRYLLPCIMTMDAGKIGLSFNIWTCLHIYVTINTVELDNIH